MGAIRSRARESFDPASLLKVLNECLLGRSGGHFATCLVAELKPEGTIRIANAGHLPSYLNGHELEMEGSLPLGLSDEIEASMSELLLQPGDRLTFLTDGIVEAMNAKGELFGFDRTQAISSRPATEIVQQAQAHGQQDDIAVLGIEFAGVAQPCRSTTQPSFLANQPPAPA